ncbi:hypothetical protein [Peribacillus muralis]|uniref:hypothetical protein n=1 Tax=Peribacillus muralis TaxID=264697 RepID=UPI000708CC1F|nr:hypothetical protein [Peribacillus muralis]MCK1993206.1 hypothetical protein [Peribacillus muralis]MCK2013760.1 hypothetical protein [Peribacillus muralis]
MVNLMLKRGLAIISQCKRETGDIWQAHFGAAAIAGHFFVKDNELTGSLAHHIFSQMESMVESNFITVGKWHVSGGELEIVENLILQSLDKTIDRLHWVGHNVIYGAISLLAIHDLKESGEGAGDDLSGIADLILSFENSIPGRSWIGFSASEVKRMKITKEDGMPVIENAKQLSHFVLEELAQFPIIYRAESHHDLIGHMITFSHALNILFDAGHVSLFKRGLSPLFKLIKVLRGSRDVKPGDEIKLFSPIDHLPLQKAVRSELLPTECGFWTNDYSRNSWDFGHIFKFPFSFYDHLRRVERVKDQYIENFRYMINQ